MNEATLQYVRQHSDDDVRMLALRGCKDADVDLPLALQQIQGRQTARHKLPTWAANDGIMYPPHLNMEQCSSERTARYKADLARRLLPLRPTNATDKRPHTDIPLPTTLIDLTGGFGVDFAMMSEVFTQAIYVERNSQLYDISSANLRILGRQNVETACADGVEFLSRYTGHANMIFLDPARRDDHGGRTYGIADCTPNVLHMRDELLAKADVVVLKLSPMLDWGKAVSDLGPEQVQEVHIVSVGGECKEMLVVLSARPLVPTRLVCVNDADIFEVSPLPSHPSTFTSSGLPFTVSGSPLKPDVSPLATDVSPLTSDATVAGSQLYPPYSELTSPLYLYEPNASIMKAGCFAELSQCFGVAALAPNSHLFVSHDFISDFPGRKFLLSTISTMNKRDLKEALRGIAQANIAVRNFPISVAELRRRLKLSEGGSTYIFATTLAEGNRVLLIGSRL